MASKTEFLPVITKLLEKSKEGKVDWKGTFESSTFICALDGAYSFEVEKDRTQGGMSLRRLTMKDKNQEEVFVLRANTPTPQSSQENDQLWLVLDELFERARRIALDVDQKVSEVNKILDKI